VLCGAGTSPAHARTDLAGRETGLASLPVPEGTAYPDVAIGPVTDSARSRSAGQNHAPFLLSVLMTTQSGHGPCQGPSVAPRVAGLRRHLIRQQLDNGGSQAFSRRSYGALTEVLRHYSGDQRRATHFCQVRLSTDESATYGGQGRSAIAVAQKALSCATRWHDASWRQLRRSHATDQARPRLCATGERWPNAGHRSRSVLRE
jgi:hypothetical protein